MRGLQRPSHIKTSVSLSFLSSFCSIANKRFLVDIIHAHGDHPDVPKGYPGAGKDVPRVEYISNKAQKTFDIKFRTLEEVSLDTLAALRAKGF